jgi:exodeoxyribonuclease-1
MGYVFFDTETTGLDPAFDQIVHFAAVRTDHDLNELGRFELRARLQPHVVPHPGALRANGIPISRLNDRSYPSHYEMVCKIRRRLIAWSPAIFVGFNSIGFDEHVLRQALFQSLWPAYLTSQHQNGRADAFGLAQAACALTPGCLLVPRKPDGRPSFKLDQLAPANGVVHEGAHSAMSDALATVALCRLVKQRSPEAWQRFVRFSNRAAVTEFVDGEDGFVLTEFFGGEPYHRAVVCIGRNPTNPNGRFCLDLAVAPEVWRAMPDADIRAEIARKGTPVRRVRVNGAPTLSSLYDAADELLNGLDPAIAETRARQFKNDPGLCRKIVALYSQSWADVPPSPHVERRLYSDGFPSDADQQRMFDFHEATARGRLKLTGEFEDQRLKAFAQRLVHAEHRSVLDSNPQRMADVRLAHRLMEDSSGPLTLPQALAETEKLIADPIGDPLGLLAGYREHIVARIDRIASFYAEMVA